MDAVGNLFIADACNNTVREIAQPLYWDPAESGTADAGGAGTWTADSNDNTWYDPLLGGDVAWCEGSHAVFAGAAGTVALSGTVSPASITFDADNRLDLNGNSITVGSLSGSSGTISNDNPASPSVLSVYQDAGTAAFYGNIQDGSSAVSLNMAGNGTLVVLGDNTYSGQTTVCNGALVVTTASAVADTALTVGAGGTFIFDPDYTPPAATEASASAVQDPGRMSSLQNLWPTPPAGNAGGTPVQDIAPVVTAIQCGQLGPNGQVTIGQSLVDADSVVFRVAFNKSVTGVAPSDFAIAGNGAGGTVDAVSGSGCQYAVTVSGVTGSGPLGLVILAENTIADQYGTPLAQTTIAVDQQFTISRELYWDPSGNAAAGGTAAWDRGQNWRVGGPAGPLQGWCDGSDVFLGGAATTISIANPVVVSSITVLGDGFSVEGDALTLGSPQTTIDVASGAFVVDADLAGSGARQGWRWRAAAGRRRCVLDLDDGQRRRAAIPERLHPARCHGADGQRRDGRPGRQHDGRLDHGDALGRQPGRRNLAGQYFFPAL